MPVHISHAEKRTSVRFYTDVRIYIVTNEREPGSHFWQKEAEGSVSHLRHTFRP
jgi:hypothetical protein